LNLLYYSIFTVITKQSKSANLQALVCGSAMIMNSKFTQYLRE